MATLIAAACHDFKHNGYNNNFYINTSQDLATIYNGIIFLTLDNSVLENMHVSETFKLLKVEKNNMFEKLTPEQYRTIRRRMIECILGTDMALHGKKFSEIKSKLTQLEIKNGSNIESLILPDSVKDSFAKNMETQQLILSQCVHTADLSNPAKLNKIFVKWTELVYQEFFIQGDTERQSDRAISMLCDRTTTNINKSQIGFINFVVLPQFNLMFDIMPEIQTYVNNIQINLKYYENEVEKEKK
jgi:hypothetical protein